MQPFDLEHAVNRQSWEWLFDVSRRLDIGIELIDARGVPLFPEGSTQAAAALRRMLAEREAPLAAALADLRDTNTPTPVAIDRFQVLCGELSPAGTLILSQALADGDRDENAPDLAGVASWLTGAIEASLLNPVNAISVEPYRIASLARILNDAVAYGSARKLIGAFVEVLGVWDNVRVRAYAAGAAGRFVHYVSPVGARSSSVPADIDDGALLRRAGIVRSSRSEADELGFAGEPGDVLMLQLLTGEDPGWLLVFSGSIDGAEQARLTLYSDMLRESLEEVQAAATGRVIGAVPQHQIGRNETLDAATQTALEQITQAVGGHQAALTVTTVTGIRALALGNTSLLPAADDLARSDRLVVTSSDTASVMTVVVAREQPPFMAFEREIVKSAVAVLHPWIQAALLPSAESERRRRFKPLDSVFDQLAAKAVDAGQEASVIVVSVDAEQVSPGLLQSWLGSIRVQLRAGDFAGILSDNEIAVLLCDTSADQAAVVSSRLKQLVESHSGAGTSIHPAVCATTCSPELPFEGSLVGAARAGAAAGR